MPARFPALAAIFISLAMLALIGWTAPPIRAECNPGRPDDLVTYTAGADRQPAVPVGGVYSYICNYPNPYTTNYSEQYVNAKNGPIFGRVGWREWRPDYRVTYVTYRLSATGFQLGFNHTPPQPQWQYSYYTVLHNRQNPGIYTFQVNGQTIRTASGSQNYPLWGQVKGETGSLSNQMPGGYQNNSFFYETHIWFNGGWQAFNGTTQYTAPYHGAYGSGLSWQIWDFGCP